MYIADRDEEFTLILFRIACEMRKNKKARENVAKNRKNKTNLFHGF